ncbi:MAG: RNA 2',3'-cyclic phosphodiesterase [Alphaproteobacteria bacterium]|nr:RNA 2',3'-cyclic phosphodiesterase [Alphaproteobacteria bacterium]
MIRLFTAVAIPERHRQHLAATMHGIKGARWVAEENLHVTLRFIGEVDEDVALDLDAALAEVRGEPFTLAVQGVGAFGHPPRVLWAGVKAEPEGALAHLHAAVESALVRAGLEPEGRKFAPHITLARFKGRPPADALGMFLEDHALLTFPEFTVEGFILYRSILGHEGPHYDAIAEYQL